MRKFFLTAFVLSAMLVLAGSALALEKTAMRMTDDDLTGGWTAAGTCTVQYYNTCTGWIWLWGGWSPGDIIGTCYDTCCGTTESTLLAMGVQYFRNVAPAGYGFTGVTAVQGADANCCPTGVIASAPLLPILRWNITMWNVNVPPRFALTYEFGPGAGTPLRPSTDHPDAGPTGPAACGTCYPTTRVAHSFYYGTAGNPLCPGSTFFDGLCDSELLGLASLYCTPVSVEETSWGNVKNLYR